MEPSADDHRNAIDAWLRLEDQHAARWLFETYRPNVHEAVHRCLPNEQTIEDITQDTFIQAFKALPFYIPQDCFGAWIGAIARHCCEQHLRQLKESMVRCATDCCIDDFTDKLVIHDPALIEQQEVANGVDRLLAQLKQRDRQIMTLYYFEGRNTREVGTSLGLTEGHVRICLMRSHRALRAQARLMRAAGIF